MSYQVITTYAGQRILDEAGIPDLADAKSVAEDLWRDAPIEIVNEHTGHLHSTYDGKSWHRYGAGTTRDVLGDE